MYLYALVKNALMFCFTLQVQHNCWKFCNHPPKYGSCQNGNIHMYNITNIISLLLRVSVKELCFDPGSIFLYLFDFYEHLRITEM